MTAQSLAPEDLQKLVNLQMLARNVVEGFCSGLHRSPHKGSSVEFKQHRQYVAGDEIRHLDWKVFGKSDRFYIREFEEETNLRATLLLDCSGSMRYGHDSEAGETKHRYAVQLAASLGYLLLRQQDSVGLVTFDQRVQRYIPPRSRASHLSILMDVMQSAEVGSEGELAGVLREILPKLQRRGVVVVISDCFGDVGELMNALAQFRFARHEVIVFQVWHPDELDFPFDQWTRFDCLEQSDLRQLVDSAHLRAAYMETCSDFKTTSIKDAVGIASTWFQ